MSKRTSDDDQNSQLEDVQGWLEEFQEETDRATAVLGAAFVDAQLESLLKSVMKEEPKQIKSLLGPGREIGGFMTRARLAYCLDLISRETFDELQAIARVRNKFAHGLHGLTFASPEVVKLCGKLKIPDVIKKLSKSPVGGKLETDARFRYITSLAITQGQIGLTQPLVEKVPRSERSITALIKRHILGITRGEGPAGDSPC